MSVTIGKLAMLKKLINGEYGLFPTFWQFAVLGLAALTFFARIVGKMLAHKLNKQTVFSYLFSFKIHDAITPLLVVLWLSAKSFLIFYSCSLVVGIWRSSEKYDRSIWLRHLSRVVTIVMVLISIKYVFGL